MTPQLQRYYEQRMDMCSSEAWRDLMEDVEAMLVATNTLDGATIENLSFKKGELSIMRWILTLKDTSEAAYKLIQEEK